MKNPLKTLILQLCVLNDVVSKFSLLVSRFSPFLPILCFYLPIALQKAVPFLQLKNMKIMQPDYDLFVLII